MSQPDFKTSPRCDSRLLTWHCRLYRPQLQPLPFSLSFPLSPPPSPMSQTLHSPANCLTSMPLTHRSPPCGISLHLLQRAFPACPSHSAHHLIPSSRGLHLDFMPAAALNLTLYYADCQLTGVRDHAHLIISHLSYRHLLHV
jgi:hypothetical protein